MKIICISDTHGQHHRLELPKGDMLIHAGDVSKNGQKEQIVEFLTWFSSQPHPYKIFIAGNHDFLFENAPEEIPSLIPDNCMYLNDSGVEIEGIKIWGSPITPFFFNWAFNRHRGEDIKKHWDLIPSDTNLLISHGPPYQILDGTTRGDAVGCQDLWNAIQNIPLRLNVFGHIHEAYGQLQKGNTTFVNASVLNEQYQLVNAPVVFEM